MKKSILLYTLVFMINVLIFGQTPNMNHFFKNYYINSLNHIDVNFHTASQPYSSFEVEHLIDTIFDDVLLKKESFISRKLFDEHLVSIEKEDFNIYINPLFNLSIGSDSEREEVNIWRNGRGLQVRGQLGDQFRFYTDFLENQAQLPGYIQEYTNNRGVLPGEGIPKTFKDKGARDFAYVSSFFTFKAKKFFDFEFGYGKNFIGEGYRSLLLSDNSFNYPYFKINTTFWKIKYTNLYTQMLDVRFKNADGTFVKKYNSTHYLSMNIGKRLNVGLFESIVYQDSSGTRGYEVSYLNPIIFYRPVEFALGSGGGNVLIGLNLKYKLTHEQFVYGQIILDEFKLDEIQAGNGWWANKYGFQIGFKSFNTFIPNLTFQTEFNTARPYTYTHTDALQNYGHYGQPLAHPLGSNFVESMTIIHYYYQRWFSELRLMYAIQGLDEGGTNWGGDIYLNNRDREMDFGNETLQGIETNTFIADLKIGYLINPKTNLRLEIGLTYRNFSPEVSTSNLQSSTTNYFYFGLINRIGNSYYDI